MSEKKKWVYVLNESDDGVKYKQIITNRRSCPSCGEYRRLEKVCTFIIFTGVGIMKPYHCKECGVGINIATGELLNHVNENGRNYPLDESIQPDIPLWRDYQSSTQTARENDE